jgi:hypothetical protein
MADIIQKKLVIELSFRNYLLECPTFEVVASILRVSTVLDFPKLREYAVHCLMDAWPVQLEKFSVTSKWLEYSAAALQLAKDCDVPIIRKRALYELVRLASLPEVWNQSTTSD